MQHVFGAIPSPADPRNYTLDMIAGGTMDSFEKEFLLKPTKIYDQDEIPACVGNSLGMVREMVEEKQNGHYIALSPTWLYGYRTEKQYQGDNGFMMSQALDNLKNVGIPPLELCPWNEIYSILKTKISANLDKLLPAAAPYRISGYARLNSELEIKRAIKTLGPVPCILPIYSNAFFGSHDDHIEKPETGDYIEGNHAMSIIGWSDRYWAVLNSAGPSWWWKGYCYIAMDYPFYEYWAITDDILPTIWYVVHANKPANQDMAYALQQHFMTMKVPGNIMVINDKGQCRIAFGGFSSKEKAREFLEKHPFRYSMELLNLK